MHAPCVDNRQLTDSVQLKSVNGVSFGSEVRTAVTIFVTLFRIYVSPMASFARRPISEPREAKETHERGTRRRVCDRVEPQVSSEVVLRPWLGSTASSVRARARAAIVFPQTEFKALTTT